MSIAIRRATREDIPVIAAFNRNLAWETEHKKLDDSKLAPGVAAVFADPAKGFYLVAESQGDIVGQLMITFEWSDWRNGWFWWIQSVYIRADHRRQGVFRKLYEEAGRMGAERGDVVGFRLYVERDNEQGKRTYRGLGMEEIPFDLYQTEVGRDSESSERSAVG